MTNKNNFSKIIWVFASIFLFSFFSCEDDIQIPTPSTQAIFESQIESFFQDTESGKMIYEVEFINLSTMAATFLWDFGNGETSTEENPGIVTFTGSGIYDVTLEITPLPAQGNLHYNNLKATERLLLVPTIFFEGFDDPELETDFPPEGWQLIDLDGDGHNWYWDEFEGEYYMLSRSWGSATGPLTPDNWIITPAIDLTEVTGGIALEWDVTPTANQSQYRLENYSVLISTTGDDPDNFTEVFNERLEAEMTNWEWITRNIDVSQYSGETIYIAFRHHDSTDFDRIALTNIHLFQSGN